VRVVGVYKKSFDVFACLSQLSYALFVVQKLLLFRSLPSSSSLSSSLNAFTFAFAFAAALSPSLTF
jgi:hypothetical protein